VFGAVGRIGLSGGEVFGVPWGFHGVFGGIRVRIQFGDCTLDSDTRELFRDVRSVHLSPKAFRLLELLLEGRPRALAKSEIHEKVWPDAVVSEAPLASLIAEIRDAIGDSGKDGRYIRTIHGFGYAFAAAASDAGSRFEPSWKLLWEDREIPLPDGETILGRDHLAGVCIHSEKVSRRHARIVAVRDRVTLEDLGSKNGTYLRGKRIDRPVVVTDGDEFRIGSATMTLRSVTDTQSTQTEIQE
jgi:DNA-binding winged helix-turn-helix (wHTH) protein